MEADLAPGKICGDGDDDDGDGDDHHGWKAAAKCGPGRCNRPSRTHQRFSHADAGPLDDNGVLRGVRSATWIEACFLRHCLIQNWQQKTKTIKRPSYTGSRCGYDVSSERQKRRTPHYLRLPRRLQPSSYPKFILDSVVDSGILFQDSRSAIPQSSRSNAERY